MLLYANMFVTLENLKECTLYVTGAFRMTLQFIEDYPNKPPTVRFVSRMFHPNSKTMVNDSNLLVSFAYSSSVFQI